MKKKITIQVYIYLITIVAGCENSVNIQNNPPIINKVYVNPSAIKIMDQIKLTCIASDEDGDNLQYTWLSSHGSFLELVSQSSTVWEAPSSKGIYQIIVKVSDGKELIEKKIEVNVDDNLGKMSGYIWDKGTNKTISGAKIKILDKIVYSDDNGFFKIDNPIKGTYKIIVEKEKYINYEGEIIFENKNKNLDISLEYTLADIIGTISNNITNEFVPGIKVKIDNKEVITNENGYFEIFDIHRKTDTLFAFGDIGNFYVYKKLISVKDRVEHIDIKLESKSCPDVPYVVYEGKTYNTVKIANQCWLKENLDVGIMIHESENQTQNEIIEKYCYDNNPVNCETNGGLYQWDEAMQYVRNGLKIKGICPTGWHIPTQEEFKTLRTNADNQGDALKTVSYNSDSDLINSSGFSALFSGGRTIYDNNFYGINNNAIFWSIENDSFGYAYTMQLTYKSENIDITKSNKFYGFSLRCIKN